MSGDFDFEEVKRLEVDLGHAPRRVVEQAKLAVRKTGLDTVLGAQARVPVDTGNLKNSIGLDLDAGGLGFDAGPTANYGADVEYGTRPHEIRAKNAKALHWIDAATGEDRFARRVSHPGTEPQPYMGPAFEDAVEPFVQALGSIGGRILE